MVGMAGVHMPLRECGPMLEDPEWASTQYIRLSLGTLMEELGEGLRALEGIGTLQEDQQSQLTWTLGALRV